jgi:hypothetical protein
MSPRSFRSLACSAVIGVAAVSAVVAATRTQAPRTSALPQAKPADEAVPKEVRPARDDNPAVEPGKVRWHGSFDDARIAAQRSGKPVLLFHLMGRLDRQFC